MKPLVEIGFMPEALSTKPQPYRHDWRPGLDYNRIYTGWAYPPKDYDKWRELIFQWVAHSVKRYGQREVESWYWEVWNEPDIGYWQGTPEEFQKLYDYAADGLKRALPTARIGGPHVTGPNGARTQGILRAFLEHCLRGTNFATGKIGSPLDFVAFHAKGAPRFVDGHVRMGISNQLRAIANGFQIVASFPELRDTPIIIGESDPEGCAACGVATNPENAYRNGTDVLELHGGAAGADLRAGGPPQGEPARLGHLGVLFEDQPYFAGFRDLATNGIDKPVLNVFRMLGRMLGERVTVESTGALPLESRARHRRPGPARRRRARDPQRAHGLRPGLELSRRRPPGAAGRSRTDRGGRRRTIGGRDPPARRRDAQQLLRGVEADGIAAAADAGAIKALERAGQLQALEPSRRVHVEDGRVRLTFALPRQGVSLVRLSW